MSRTPLSFHLRLIQAAILSNHGFSNADIARILKRDRSTVTYYLIRFDEEIQNLEWFRWMATGVEYVLRERTDMAEYILGQEVMWVLNKVK